jgi:hypothetical protein
MPPFAFAPVTIPNARAKGAREPPARRAALVIPGSQVVDEGQSVPGRSGSASPDTTVHKFVVTNRILAQCPIHFSAAQNSAAPAKMRRGLSFVAAVLPPMMRTRT